MGEYSKLLGAAITSIVLMIALCYAALMLRPDARRTTQLGSVKVYVAAGVAKPVEQLVKKFNQQYGANIEIARIGGSGELAGQVKTEFLSGSTNGADLLVTADADLLEDAIVDGIVAESMDLAVQRPVIAVGVNSSLKIKNVLQLVRTENIRYGVASQRAAVGKLTREMARANGVLDELEAGKTVDAENVMTLAQALAAGSLDAAVIWDTTVWQVNSQHPKPVLKVISDPAGIRDYRSEIRVGIISSTSVATESLRFARFLTAKETGQDDFEQFGFSFIVGDTWKEVPELHIYFGSMFTPVLETVVREFAQREGVNIYPRWEGCGKLVSAIRTNKDSELFPDAFLACDRVFLEQVSDEFEAPQVFSTNEVVMAVSKKVPVAIDSPSKIIDANLRVGICDPESSALGKLTQDLLSNPPYTGLYSRIAGEAAVTVDVGPTLVSQLLSEGLDVGFVYRSNLLADRHSMDELNLVKLASDKGNATQPWAISKSTPHAQLVNRLFERINQADVRSKMTEFGFGIN